MSGQAADFVRQQDPQQLSDEVIASLVPRLAELLMQDASRYRRRSDRRQAAQLARLIDDPAGKAFTFALADRLFRSRRASVGGEQLRGLLRDYGAPVYLGRAAQTLLRLLGPLSRLLPDPILAGTRWQLRRDTRQVLVPAEPVRLQSYTRRRRKQDVRLNINHLGEAILGMDEADRRLEAYRRLMAMAHVDFVSVKLSSVTSRLEPAAFEQTATHLAGRIRPLLEAALRGDTWLTFDMEEYRDLHLTVAALREALHDHAFASCRVGVALQGYLPDSMPVLEELIDVSAARVAAGGTPLKVRIVKGANLAMEQVEAAQRGWRQAPFESKADVDAQYKRMLALACRHADVLRVGVGSHNLFDICYALLLRRRHACEEQVELEMLEGMANDLAGAAAAAAGGLLLYAPAVGDADFTSAIAYLVRRLDENTEPGNFLAASFGLRVGDVAWKRELNKFVGALRGAQGPAPPPRRDQDRATEPASVRTGFSNDAETDWCQAGNRAWIAAALQARAAAFGKVIPAVIDDQQLATDLVDGRDPSQPGVVAYRYAQVDEASLRRAITCGNQALGSWAMRKPSDRALVLRRVAQVMRRRRADLLSVCVADGGKTVVEADPEVCEAIDFADYYAHCLEHDELHNGVALRPRGLTVVAPPWNFPVSIPAGGVLAALAAGNSVILKPAPEAVWAAWEICQCCWQAGVDRRVLQFLPCADEPVGRRLIRDSGVAQVILTGASATARLFQRWRPDLYLLAETGGKNSIIVTPRADREAAVKDIVASAFGHAGQKCSACSLVIAVGEVYDDPAFARQLRDATASLPVGSAWDAWHKVTPLIRPPGPELSRALTELDRFEHWLLEPRVDQHNQLLWHPGIRWGVQPQSWFQHTECFGPVLGVMRARTLREAMQMQNAVAYGLTGGLHSLDEGEQREWVAGVQVGNAYINRSITGAVVRRQPFGGWKQSAFGPGAKAGGPHYVSACGRLDRLGQVRGGERQPLRADLTGLVSAAAGRLRDADAEFLQSAARHYQLHWQNRFGRAHDPSALPGEVNQLRYRPLARLVVRVEADALLLQVALILVAARTVGVPVHLSVVPQRGRDLAWLLKQGASYKLESSLSGLEDLAVAGGRVRLLGRALGDTIAQIKDAGVSLLADPLTGNGYHDLHGFFQEQSLSHRYHRYGNRSLGSPFLNNPQT